MPALLLKVSYSRFWPFGFKHEAISLYANFIVGSLYGGSYMDSLKLSNGTQECGERAVKTLLFLRFHFVNYNCSGGGARAFAFPLKIKKVADYHGTQIQPSD